MSEEEIIEGITNIIYTCNDVIEDKEWYNQEEIESAKEQLKFIEGLLDLYNKEKAKNKRYEKYLKNKDKEQEKVLEYIETEKEADYISKDKIREYIKENKRIYEMKTPNRNRVVYTDCVLLTEEAKKILEEN